MAWPIVSVETKVDPCSSCVLYLMSGVVWLQLGEGDYVDYVFTNEEGVTKLKRVRVIKIDDSGVASEKLKIYLRAWRSPQDP